MNIAKCSRCFGRQLPIGRISSAVVLVVALALAVSGALRAQSDDIIVVSKAGQSLSAIVVEALNSDRFLSAVAAYNGVKNSYAALPQNTEIRIPKPYLPLRDFGKILFVKGDVSHQQGDILVNPPVRGSQVFEGDIFTTGPSGFVNIQFNSGARASVQPSSRMTVAQIDCTDIARQCDIGLKASYGEVGSDIDKPSSDAAPIQYTIETPYLSATVRGTKFYATATEDSSSVGVTDGEVLAAAGGASFELPQGQGLYARAGAAAEQIDLLPPPQHPSHSDTVLMSAEDAMHWQRISGAQGYRVVVATDSDLINQQFLIETVLPQWVPDVAAGDYFVAVSGFDQNGMSGLPSTRQIRFASIDDQTAPQLTIEKQGSVFRLSPLTPVDGPVQLMLANSLDADAPFQHRTLDQLTDTLELNLPSTQNWVIRARHLLGPYSVSVYTDYYFFNKD